MKTTYFTTLAFSLLLPALSLAEQVTVIPLPADTSDDKQFLFNDKGTTAGAEVYYDKATTNVGIGTSTPTVKLDVEGTVQATSFTAAGTPLQSSNSSLWSFSNGDLFTLGDTIIEPSLAVGEEAIPGIDFQFDILILMDRDVRLLFQDTSVTASFPSNDWRLTINDIAFGGDGFFAIDDVTANTRPFVIGAGAPDNSLVIAATSGNVGIGTSTPQSSLQVSGYLQLDLTTGAPPLADCDENTEVGRMIVDSGAEVLYVCSDGGWAAK